MFKLLLSLVLFLIVISQTFASESKVIKTYGNGFLEMRGDVPFLHLKGSEFEMGKQYGALAANDISSNIENLKKIGESEQPDVKYLPNSIFTWLRKIVGFAFWVYFPSDVKDHIKGIVAGAKEIGVKLNKYDIAFVNAIPDIVGIAGGVMDRGGLGINEENKLLRILGLSKFVQQCDSMAVWGARTVGGKTFQTRNTDITTGVGIERYPIIIVYKADGKIPFVTAAFSGMVGIFTGINAYGVALGQVWAFSKDVKLSTPWNISLRKVFAESKSAKEAVANMRLMNNTTYGNNFVVADAGENENANDTGFVVEMTGKDMASFVANDQRELMLTYQGVPYGYPIPNGVFRGDLSLDPDIRSHQMSGNGPDGDARASNSYILRYKGQYDRIIAFEEKEVLIGHLEAESISRETAMKTSSLQTAVYANTDRDFWVSYSKIMDDGSVVQAFEREYVNIPFYKYLVDLKKENGVVKIKNWFKQRLNLKLRILSHNQITSEKTIDLMKDETLSTGIMLAKGDSVELYDGDLLIDRMK